MLRKISTMAIAVVAAVLIWTGCDVLGGGTPTPTPSSAPTPTATPSPSPVGTGTPLWAKTVSTGPDVSEFKAVTKDSSGNIYAVGAITGADTYNFGNSVTSTGTYGGSNVLLVKYDASGTAQWAKTVSTGLSDSSFLSVTTDSSGNVYAAGYIVGTDTFDFGNSVTVTGVNSNYNVLLVKYDASGTAQWAQTVSSGSSRSQFVAVTTDSSGNVYAAGYIRGTGSFGFGNSVTATGTYSGLNALLVKYNASGTAQWAKTVSSGSDNSQFLAVTTDSSGNVYAAGYISSTVTFDFGNSVTATGKALETSNVLLVKYDASGTAQWAQTLSIGSSYSRFYGVTTDSSGKVYAAGTISGTDPFGFGNSVTATGASADDNVLLVKYDASGTAQWAQTASTGPSDNSFLSVTTDSSDNVYAAGYITGADSYGFGNSVTVSSPYSDESVLLVKYNASGTAQWAKTVSSGSGAGWFNGVTIDGSGHSYAAGVIGNTGTFGFGGSVTATGANTGSNAVLVKYE